MTSSVSITETFAGVEGELNAKTRIDTPFRDETGLAFRDPHHGDRADETFHRTDEEIANLLETTIAIHQHHMVMRF